MQWVTVTPPPSFNFARHCYAANGLGDKQAEAWIEDVRRGGCQHAPKLNWAAAVTVTHCIGQQVHRLVLRVDGA